MRPIAKTDERTGDFQLFIFEPLNGEYISDIRSQKLLGISLCGGRLMSHSFTSVFKNVN